MNKPFDIVALEASNSLDFLKKAFALYDSGTLFAICRPETDLSIYPALHVVQRLQAGTRHGWAKLHHAPAKTENADRPAQVVFSSGTEGRPKAILLSGRALADVEERLLNVMNITADIREYIGVPVTYSFGLGRARVVARAGGEMYLPKAFDPVEIRDLLAAGQINAISAVPSLWRLLLAQPGFLGDLGAQVRWIEIGSQYMSAGEKSALKQMFPNARIVQHYGLTEASRTTFLAIDEVAEDALESVGGPVGQTEIKIGTEGEICIRGPHLALGILNDAGTLTPLTDDDGWLHTKDRGDIRDGHLYYGGRLDDQINLSGIKFASETLERQVAELVTVNQAHFAITSVPDPLRGEALLLAYDDTAAPSARLLEAALAQVLAGRGVTATGQMRTLALASLPVTGSGKVQRKSIRALWQDQASAHPQDSCADDSALSPDEARIAATWRTVLGAVPLTPQSSFYDVGGDSLGALQIGLAMEAHYPRAAVRATLEGRTIADIAALISPEAADAGATSKGNTDITALPPRTIEGWALNLTRGFMVLSVLMSHWMPGVWARVMPGLQYDPLAFISRMGTPGFAIVFGIGIGYIMLNGYPNNARSLTRRMQVSLTLVGIAIVLSAITQLTLDMIEDHTITGTRVGEAFYGVLGYYFLALLTLPWGLRLLHGRVARVCALAIPILWFLWLVAIALWGNIDKLSTPLEWGRLMLVAKYSYLHMTAMVMIGVFIGWRMLQLQDPLRFAREACLIGLFLLLIALVAIYEQYGPRVLIDREDPFWVGLDGAVFYAGFTCLFLAGAIGALHIWNRIGSFAHLVMKGFILLGALALPIYAFHQLVIPFKDILTHMGFHESTALVLSMGLFLAAIGYGMMRLRRMYFQ